MGAPALTCGRRSQPPPLGTAASTTATATAACRGGQAARQRPGGSATPARPQSAEPDRDGKGQASRGRPDSSPSTWASSPMGRDRRQRVATTRGWDAASHQSSPRPPGVTHHDESADAQGRPGGRPGRGPAHGPPTVPLTGGRPHRHVPAPVRDPFRRSSGADPRPGRDRPPGPGRSPSPRSRTVSWTPPPAAAPGGRVPARPGLRVIVTQASPVPAWAATLASASRVACTIAPATGRGMSSSPLPATSRVTRRPRARIWPATVSTPATRVAAAGAARLRGTRRGPRGPAPAARCRATAPGHHRRPAAPAADGGQRVQHGVVQQALVFAPFDGPGQDDVLVMRFFGVGGGEAAVGLARPGRRAWCGRPSG